MENLGRGKFRVVENSESWENLNSWIILGQEKSFQVIGGLIVQKLYFSRCWNLQRVQNTEYKIRNYELNFFSLCFCAQSKGCLRNNNIKFQEGERVLLLLKDQQAINLLLLLSVTFPALEKILLAQLQKAKYLETKMIDDMHFYHLSKL